jgi:hypothetical protein
MQVEITDNDLNEIMQLEMGDVGFGREKPITRVLCACACLVSVRDVLRVRDSGRAEACTRSRVGDGEL